MSSEKDLEEAKKHTLTFDFIRPPKKHEKELGIRK